MDTTEITKEIDRVLELFGMTGVKAAEAMGVTYATFNSKKNPNNDRHKFNQKNLDDLKNFIREAFQKL